MNTVIVGIAECKASANHDDELTTFALGSCIGLAVYDPLARVGGLLHYMLPDSAIGADEERNAAKFADTGIPLLLDQVRALGASTSRLEVWAAGAASMLSGAGYFEIGKRNHQALRKILWKRGLLLRGETVGGNVSRSVRLEIATGRFWIQESGEQKRLFQAGKKGLQEWPIAS